MKNLIFLDNWVFSDYTKPDKLPHLSNYIRNKQLTIVIDSLSMVELYNPGWKNAQENDRVARTTKFISQHPTIIIDPVKVFRSEIENYPQQIPSIPTELDLEVMSAEKRERVLKMFLHHDELFIKQGKVIRVWAENYKKLKSEWLEDIEKMINNAVQTGVLTYDKTMDFTKLKTQKENFLITLDRRHFSHFNEKEWEQLGAKIVELFMGATSSLPAIRFTSLCFWYAYIQTDKSHLISRAPSDIGDFYQMSLIPYCDVFTADNKMQWLSKRIAEETSSNSCRILNRNAFEKEIGFIS